MNRDLINAWPFTPDSMVYILGKKLTYGTHVKTCFQFDQYIELLPDKTIIGCYGDDISHWDVQDGNLLLQDKRKKTNATFDCLRVRNDSVFADGKIKNGSAAERDRFLIPYRSAAATDIRLCIPTHPKYAELTLKKLLRSIKKYCPRLKDNLLIVVADSEADKIEVKDGITYSYATHNSWEYTGLIDIAEKGHQADSWFLLHDTCEIGPKFEEKLMEMNVGLNFDIQYMTYVDEKKFVPVYNIGLYNDQFLKRNEDFFCELKDIPKVAGVHVEMGIKQKGIKNIAQIYGLHKGEHNRGKKLKGFKDVYTSGTKRDIVYLPEIDMFKYQTRWDDGRGIRGTDL